MRVENMEIGGIWGEVGEGRMNTRNGGSMGSKQGRGWNKGHDFNDGF